MTRLGIEAVLNYRLPAPTTFVFNVEAARSARQDIVSETVDAGGLDLLRHEVAGSGNRLFRLVAGAGPFRLAYRAVVEVRPLVDDPARVGEVPTAAVPILVLPYLNPSRYCQSDQLARFAWRQFGQERPGHQRVGSICNWIAENIDYESGSTTPLTSAFDTVTMRAGVCRDFAHLGIALCRALGIPARYVSAYASQLWPPDFHAVMEAWLDGPEGGAWYVFDPTRKTAVDELVRIGVGRDATDVAFAWPFGAVAFDPPSVSVTGGRALDAPVTTAAVRLSDGV